MRMRVAILIVSDRGYSDPAYDQSGPAIRQWFSENFPDQHQIIHQDIVPDEITSIQKTVCKWIDDDTDQKIDLLLTSGGTGFSPRDKTPEAIGPLLDRQTPGIVVAIMKDSLDITPLAMLSRPIAGIRRETLIITLPGSPKACRENLTIIKKTLPHAVQLLSGSASQHVVAADRSSGCQCGSSFSESLKPGRDENLIRVSPFPMISVDEGQKIVLNHASMLQEVIEMEVSTKLVGFVIAEDVFSKYPVPSFRASTVDGYAIAAPNKKGVYPVSDVVLAGSAASNTMETGSVCRITTGAPVPPGADAVVMIEDTSLVESTTDGREVAVEIHAELAGGTNVRPIGSDIPENTLLLPKYQRVSKLGGEIGLLISAGVKIVKVFRKPRVAIFSTGNEILDARSCATLQGSAVWDSNRPSLMAILESCNIEVVDLGISQDHKSSIRKKFEASLACSDIIVSTGGVSMGESDFIKDILKELGAVIHFGRVNMKPGKPTTFASLSDKLLFGLPGNPVSAIVSCLLFVFPAIHGFSGNSQFKWVPVSAKLSSNVTLDKERPEYQRVQVRARHGDLFVMPCGSQQSSRLMSLTGANGLLILPAEVDAGRKHLPPGENVKVILLGDIQD